MLAGIRKVMTSFAPLPEAGPLKNGTAHLKEIIVLRIFGASNGSIRVHKRSQNYAIPAKLQKR